MDLVCVVLAAGKGVRMASPVPKPLVKFEGKSFLERAILAAQGVGPDEVCVVVRFEREKVEREARRVLPSCVFALQDDVPGTGRAMECALDALKADLGPDSTILAMASDIPLLSSSILSRLLLAHKKSKAAATVLAARVDDPFGYGRIILSPSGEVEKLVEEKDASPEEKKVKLVNTSVYAFQAVALEKAAGRAGRDNAQGEVYLTDLLMLCRESGKVESFTCQDPLLLRGVNSPSQLLALQKDWNGRKAEEAERIEYRKAPGPDDEQKGRLARSKEVGL
ncbi:MAG: NTP transferase domain-containing protein [Aeriscardovia sp.]|nr:NTP transferase domain-containing protein [Aeriscardovia sp.]